MLPVNSFVLQHFAFSFLGEVLRNRLAGSSQNKRREQK